MQKSRSVSSQQSSKRRAIARPEIVNIDVLALLSDEELIARLHVLEDDRTKVLEHEGVFGTDPRPWEEEIAYVRRELQVRRIRREKHDRYLKILEWEYAQEEANLPVADLDNTNFLRLVGEIN